MSQAEMEMIIHAFISSCLDYYNSLFICLNKTSLHQRPLALQVRGQRLLEVPRICLRTHGDRAFQVVAPKLWNELPFSLSLRSLILRSLLKCS
ncbi:hypothetical protein LDENG_00025720 [Lucifuga dentata]|nr:hypothetical protein LDENG_00025720 [Lucifuga dentata]